jgi:hypothetical protein
MAIRPALCDDDAVGLPRLPLMNVKRLLLDAQLLRSSSFRLAALYVAMFGSSVLILLAFIYWSTAGYLARQTDATIDSEIEGLAEQYARRGAPGLAEIIRERIARPTRRGRLPARRA